MISKTGCTFYTFGGVEISRSQYLRIRGMVRQVGGTAETKEDPTDTNKGIALPAEPAELPAELPAEPPAALPAAFKKIKLQIVSASRDGSIRIWTQLEDSDEYESKVFFPCGRNTENSFTGLPDQRYEISMVRWCEFSPDGSKIVAACKQNACINKIKDGSDEFRDGPSEWIDLCMPWGCKNGVRFYDHRNPRWDMWRCQFSPDSEQLATASTDNTVKIWDMNALRWEPLKVWTYKGSFQTNYLQELTGFGGTVKSLQYRPDGMQLATGSDDGTVRLWNRLNPAPTTKFNTDNVQILEDKESTSPVTSVQYNHTDTNELATGSADSFVRIWTIDSLEEVKCKKIKAHSHQVNSVQYSPQGDELATASDDGTVKLWNRETLECIGELKKERSELEIRYGIPPSSMNTVQYSPDGELLLTASSDRTVQLWNRKSLECIKTLNGHTSVVYSAQFRPHPKISKGYKPD